MPKKFSVNKGFTLIELLVVVLVISTLSGVLLGVINSSGVRAKARDAQRKSDLARIQTALELYFSDNRVYPQSDPSGSNDFEQVRSGSNIANALVSSYLSELPTDPLQESGGNTGPCNAPDFRRYNYKSDGSYYELTAIMEITTSKDDSPCASINVCSSGHPTQEFCYVVINP